SATDAEGVNLDFAQVAASTALVAAIMTLLMGIVGRYPFAVAAGLGLNGVVAFQLASQMSWAAAMGIVVVEGLVISVLVLTGFREAVFNAIPLTLKRAISVGIGLFIALIGFVDAGFVRRNAPAPPLTMGIGGTLDGWPIVVFVVGLLVVFVLMARRVRGAILIGIAATAAAAITLGLAERPESWLAAPPDLGPTFLALDVRGALTWGFLSVILTIFVLDLVDTVGTLVGLGLKAGLLDEQGRLPGIDRALQADAVATVVGSLLGTTTCGTYIESAAGIEAGGRTGLASLVTATWFLAALFFAPVLSAVPAAAYGPALVVVGMLMLETVGRLRFDDLSEQAPAFLTIALMAFTYDLGIGLTAGFLSWVLLRAATGRAREVPPGMWVLGSLSALFYVLYPY
ncbi:MAG: NCS2 family permease, partial [Gemmatimonadetes bacterium]|nr:NCS2 family permease [Gemmatimonadota bacterium]